MAKYSRTVSRQLLPRDLAALCVTGNANCGRPECNTFRHTRQQATSGEPCCACDGTGARQRRLALRPVVHSLTTPHPRRPPHRQG